MGNDAALIFGGRWKMRNGTVMSTGTENREGVLHCPFMEGRE